MSTVIDGSASVTINSGAILGITSGTAVASTSGTSIDFTALPSWVKRITVMMNGMSTSGASAHLIQLGISSGVVSTGYTSTGVRLSTATGVNGGASSTAGFIGGGIAAINTESGHWVITNVSGNIWVCSHTTKIATNEIDMGGGDVTLSATLDRVRITTVNGTDTFDAGTINILYE